MDDAVAHYRAATDSSVRVVMGDAAVGLTQGIRDCWAPA